jgi:hypothetical protein
MLKQKIITTTIAAFLAMGAGQAQAAEMLQKIGKGEGRVDIVAWPGYIERGETSPDFDWVTKFEKNTGCMVNIKTANTSDEMVHGIGRRVAAPGGGQARTTGQYQAGAELGHGRQAPAKCPLAYR